ncbi:MAG: hypothetical protein GX640_01900 [Fibrobacter sp.]|nr:hypothetical protein [Fibrobacter sp.]
MTLSKKHQSIIKRALKEDEKNRALFAKGAYCAFPPDEYALHRDSIHQLLLSYTDPYDLDVVKKDLCGPQTGAWLWLVPIKQVIRNQLDKIRDDFFYNVSQSLDKYFQINKGIIEEFYSIRPLPNKTTEINDIPRNYGDLKPHHKELLRNYLATITDKKQRIAIINKEFSAFTIEQKIDFLGISKRTYHNLK